ncbi:hypothetical protein JKP88DRAFT_337316, partial [Tribonema minus]
MDFYSKAADGKVDTGNFKHDLAPVLPTCSRSRSLNAVYVHVPRAASSAIRGSLMDHYPKVDFSACKDMSLAPSQPPPYAFTFVRDPMARAHSAFVESLRRLPRASTKLSADMVGKHIDAWLDELEEGIPDRPLWQHVVPQSFYLTAPGMLSRFGTVAFIGQVEAMDEHFKLLLQSLGAAPHPPEGGYRCCATPRARAIDRLVRQALVWRPRAARLCQVYAQDYACLGYAVPQNCKEALRGGDGA